MMMGSTMQLEFSQAMSDFKTMFPDMDHDVIEAVLRANQGAVDVTIDQLLAMSTDNQNEKLRNELDANISPQHSLINLNDSDATKVTMFDRGYSLETSPFTKKNLDTTDSAGSEIPSNSSCTPAAAANAVLLNLSGDIGIGIGSSPHLPNTGASPKQRTMNIANPCATPKFALTNNTPNKQKQCRWNPPILGPLPIGFLRIGTPTLHSNSVLMLSSQDINRDFDLPDEQFAIMLQNEEFMNQLRWNQEFMNALEKEQSSSRAKVEDDAAFKERLKNMGKMSRKKFLQIARVFTWQRNKKVTTAKQIDSLPLKEEPSDDEDHHHHHHYQHRK